MRPDEGEVAIFSGSLVNVQFTFFLHIEPHIHLDLKPYDDLIYTTVLLHNRDIIAFLLTHSPDISVC